LKVFGVNGAAGILPFLLVDGHGSRFQLQFLHYINGMLHTWVVVIGVMYGTTLWQVGDSPEQNGSFNIESALEKREIVDWREMTMFQSPSVEPFDIISIVSRAWKKSFACVESNKRAIAERRWHPFNRNLMTYLIVRASMTKAEKEDEPKEESPIKIPYHKTNEVHDLINAPSPILDTKYLKSIDEAKTATTFGTGIAAFCLNKIVTVKDLQEAQEWIRTNCVEGQLLDQMIKYMKGYTTGRLFRCKESRVPKEMLKVYLDNEVVTEVEAREAQQLAQECRNILRREADAVLTL